MARADAERHVDLLTLNYDLALKCFIIHLTPCAACIHEVCSLSGIIFVSYDDVRV